MHEYDTEAGVSLSQRKAEGLFYVSYNEKTSCSRLQQPHRWSDQELHVVALWEFHTAEQTSSCVQAQIFTWGLNVAAQLWGWAGFKTICPADSVTSHNSLLKTHFHRASSMWGHPLEIDFCTFYPFILLYLSVFIPLMWCHLLLVCYWF